MEEIPACYRAEIFHFQNVLSGPVIDIPLPAFCEGAFYQGKMQ
jgi:hypothetical protein